MKIHKTHRFSSKAIIAIFIVITAAVTASATWLYSNQNFASNDQTIDYSPATKKDQEFNDAHKADLGENASEDSGRDTEDDRSSATDKKEVTPVISAYGQPGGPGTDLKLNGYVPSIIETQGTCTLTLTKGDSAAITSKAAMQNAQNTSCGQLIIPFEKLTTGTWSAVLSYSSPSSTGSSTKSEINIK